VEPDGGGGGNGGQKFVRNVMMCAREGEGEGESASDRTPVWSGRDVDF